MKVTIIPIIIGAFGIITKGLLKGLEGLGRWRTSGEYPNYYIIENGQNTEKSPGDLRRFAVTHSCERPSANTDVKNSQGVNNNNIIKGKMIYLSRCSNKSNLLLFV